MDECVSKPIKDNDSDSLVAHGLTVDQKTKLNVVFEHIAEKVAINHNNVEIKDIQAAVNKMLERFVVSFNERGVFSISRIQQSGSMSENTSIWKYRRGRPYIEMDYLLVVENPAEEHINLEEMDPSNEKFKCPGCIELIKDPFDLERLTKYHNVPEGRRPELNARSLIFEREVRLCITSCKCFSSSKRVKGNDSFDPTSLKLQNDFCQCIVDMPTGTLRVCTEEERREHNAPLMFWWKSKTRSFFVPDCLLKKDHWTETLPIHVDILPALEILKHDRLGNRKEHDLFLVDKECNRLSLDVGHVYHGRNHRWRKSSCVAERDSFLNKVTKKHKKCYQIVKYLLEMLPRSVNNYHIKTVVLHHNRECSDLSLECVECVLKIMQDLQHAYEVRSLKAFHLDMNMAIAQEPDILQTQYFLELFKRINDFNCWATFIDTIKRNMALESKKLRALLQKPKYKSEKLRALLQEPK